MAYKVFLSAGHGGSDPGAVGGGLRESDINLNALLACKEVLEAHGIAVIPSRVTDENDPVAQEVKEANASGADVAVSFHANAGGGNGFEVYYYSTDSNGLKLAKLCEKYVVNEIGQNTRGCKVGDKLMFVRSTKMTAVLCESFFVDNAEDRQIGDTVAEQRKFGVVYAKAILEYLGVAYNGNAGASAPAQTPSDTPSTPVTKNLYRVRLSWGDAKSQIGAYANLDNAKDACKDGYTVYDWNGVPVYGAELNKPVAAPADNLYRVRKTWEDTKSQIGAYAVLDNAKRNCIEGYSVFDSAGNVVYTYTAPTVEEPKTEEPEAETPTTTPVVRPASPLKGMNKSQFIAFIGEKATADMEKTGILASITVAQAILESAWGQSELSLNANNLFGMKKTLSGNNWDSEWNGNCYSSKTKEEYKVGEITEITAEFRSYESVDKSIKDHSDYLRGAKKGSVLRYEGLVGEKEYAKAIQIIKDGGYATDSRYVTKICDLIEQYELVRFDNLPKKEPEAEVKPETPTPEVETKPEEKPSTGNNLTNEEIEDVEEKVSSIWDTLLKIIKSILGLLKK